jgi:hypothetical protein
LPTGPSRVAVFDGGTLWATSYSGIKFAGPALGNEDYPFVNTGPVMTDGLFNSQLVLHFIEMVDVAIRYYRLF